MVALLNGLGDSGMLNESYLETPGAVDVSDVIHAESDLAAFTHALGRRSD